MLWLLLVLGSALAQAIGQIFGKKVLFKEHALGYSSARSLLIFVFSLAFVWKMNFNFPFKIYALIYFSSILGTIGVLYATKAMRHMEVSVFAPLHNLSPIFLIIIAYFVLGETLTSINGAGIFLILFGSYFLELNSRGNDFVYPIKQFFKSKYIHFLIIALILFSFTATIEKYVINKNVLPFTLLLLIWGFIALNFFLYDVFKFGLKEFKENFLKDKIDLVFSAFFGFLTTLLYVLALPLQNISLIIPVKRLSSLFATIIGGNFFHEKHLKFKIIACVIMIIGAVLVIL